MSTEIKKEIALEIAHVLFIDIVGYSKLSINDQNAAVEELNQIVRGSEQFQRAEAAGRLFKIATGDGMALVFYTSPEAPAQCGVEISRARKEYPRLQLRMGIHSGPVSGVVDVNERMNIAGAGINMAQRVMDCGDAGHILLSHHVAEDLGEYDQWRPLLHNLGECEVKHGARISLINLYTEEVGNPAVPEKLRTARLAAVAAAAQRKRVVLHWGLFGSVVLVIAIAAIGFFSFRYGSRFALTPLVVPEKSIAVLPFENLSEEKTNAYFADGVQDEILTDLARVADLKVISRTSTMFYKAGNPRNLRQIGQQLGVANVVEGSVQRAGNRVRVNAQLIDARTDKHLWGQTYDRDLADVFAIQSEVARTIADQLQAKLSSHEEKAIERRPTSDIAAFDLYTRAKNILADPDRTDAELLQAADLLNQAVARDPSFFDAYCELAHAHDYIYNGYLDHTSGRLALAEAAIQAAARLRPDAGETHLARALNLYWGYWDYDGALAELKIAHQTLPNDFRIPQWTAYIQGRQGHWEESIRNLQRAIELNPRNMETRVDIAMRYTSLRRYADLRSTLASTLTVFPNDLNTRIWPAYVEFQEKADTRPLHQMLDSIRATNPAAMRAGDSAEWWLACALAERDATAAANALDADSEDAISFGHEVSFSRSFVEGLIALIKKDEGKARSAFVVARAEQEKLLQAQPNNSPALGLLGLIDVYLGQKEEALRQGRRAIELARAEKDVGEERFLEINLAMIAARLGDKDFAFERLDSIIRRPSPLSYGALKLFPWWDPLRGDPRFEKLVEEAKEPVALK
jgi:TolB-like protein/class 3 adenylate cyclase/Flp pilus assembly protein TadD